jgi:hypothetical protein
MFHELAAIGRGEADINRFDKASVILKVAAENLLHEFVGFQAALGGDLSQVLFFIGLEANFHVSQFRIAPEANQEHFGRRATGIPRWRSES